MVAVCIELFGECDNLAVDLDHLNGNLLQFIESFHSLFLVKILTERLYNEVIVYGESPVTGIE